MFRNLETNYYLCTDEIKRKWQEITRKSHIWRKLFHSLVIATHGIIKKTQKTPKKEIAKAERIRQEYFKAKKG